MTHTAIRESIIHHRWRVITCRVLIEIKHPEWRAPTNTRLWAVRVAQHSLLLFVNLNGFLGGRINYFTLALQLLCLLLLTSSAPACQYHNEAGGKLSEAYDPER